jgi:hypothetical protein
MDSRPILKDAKKLRIFIDSEIFNVLLKKNDRVANAILRHYDSDILDFVRNPLSTAYGELNNVVQYEIEEKDSSINSIKITKKEDSSIMAFGYRMDDIRSIAKKVCGKDEVSKEELDKIITIFIQAIFNRFEKSNIYISNDKLLLKNRLWFESHVPGYPLNIMSVEEASFFLDLFFKKHEKYYASSRYSLNKGYWYLLSMRLKLPHYHEGDPYINALANRLYYALMALDEMGIQFYLGVNNDTMDNTLYHFNYLISLMTGIFDNLALKTNTQLQINFTDLRKVSINNNAGREFLKEIRGKNPNIRDHINAYVEFINLIYLFRELVVHREGLSKTGFEGEGWKANFIKVTESIKQKLNFCGDKNSENDPFTKWGFYQLHGELFLDPYNFSIEAIKKLIEFVDKYLELLDYSSFIDSRKQKTDSFTEILNLFEKYHLGL